MGGVKLLMIVMMKKSLEYLVVIMQVSFGLLEYARANPIQ